MAFDLSLQALTKQTSKPILILAEECGPGGVFTMLQRLRHDLQDRGWITVIQSIRGRRLGALTLLRVASRSQVIIASNNFRAAYWTVGLGLAFSKPTVVWVHGPLADVLNHAKPGALRRWLMQAVYQRADAMVCVSHASRESLLRACPTLDPSRCRVFRNPAPAMTCRPEESNDPDTPIIELGFVGRLSPEKRPQLLLETLRHLPESYRLTIVGDGPIRDELEDEAMATGLQGGDGMANRVHFFGAIEVRPDVYQRWQATLMCSAYEGYPVAALESLAAGVPCISTPIPAMKEMLAERAPHWLSADDRPSSLAVAVKSALSQPARERSEVAHAIAAEHPPTAFSDQWDTLIRGLVGVDACQPSPSRTVHFVKSGSAYMPEIEAYIAFLEARGHRCTRHTTARSVPLNADIVWWFCGVVSRYQAWRLRRSFHVHEYASASVGRASSLKDFFKRTWNPEPGYRIFQSEELRKLIGFPQRDVYCVRDMGVPESFLCAMPDGAPRFDLVYLGEMSRLLTFESALAAIGRAGLNLLLVGAVPEKLRGLVACMPWVTCVGEVTQAEVPKLLYQARAGLNLVPNRRPFNLQTSTKVKEYLALGLPVVSNRYGWIELLAKSGWQDSIRWVEDLESGESWAAATAELPPACALRDACLEWAWPRVLERLPIWPALGLAQRADPG
ncbi:MAG: glycosyltransferase [Betaproteobacteria bacterium]|nr:glycosyltransferase [Betaproteobacteria bacterium]